MNAKQRPLRRRKHAQLPATESKSQPRFSFRLQITVVAVVLTSLLVLLGLFLLTGNPLDDSEALNARRARHSSTAPQPEPPAERETRYYQNGNLTLLWDSMKPEIRARLFPVANTSNITPQDYVGADQCRECHPQNHADWSTNPHRWMNALASTDTVKGDFSDRELAYRGGVARFFREDEHYRMSYTKDGITRSYEIHQTIGSRFHQYYVGIGVQGPEPEDHDFYSVDHVLPFGYWMARQTWVPVVHVSEELEEGRRWEPSEHLKQTLADGDSIEQVGRSRGVVDHSQKLGMVYSHSCNYCHTTFALADMFVREPGLMGKSLQHRSIFELSQYVAAQHPEYFDGSAPPESFTDQQLSEMTKAFMGFDAREHATTLGISCEACHLGCREHALNEKRLPAMLPEHPGLQVFSDPSQLDTGRTASNINAVCARCHSGDRPRYAAGMATWNSTEHSDAMLGSCYSQMACTNCHDIHKPIGAKWPKAPSKDDESCLKCHENFASAELRLTHTRHAAGSAGDRCMNCHMPHINEGMQDVVRTHTIYSPTQPDMLEANQPNACNLCHLDQSIDWTLGYLAQWYGKSFDEGKIQAAYRDRKEPVGVGWLNQTHEATRLVALAAFARQNARWGIPAMIPSLDDPFLLNRQFAQTSLEELLQTDLNQDYGYWYFQSQSERQSTVTKLLEQFASP